MKKNKGAISIFALLSMMFFLIFIMVGYNNISQKSKTQIETEGILLQYYKAPQTASDRSASVTSVLPVSSGNSESLLKENSQKNYAGNTANKNKYVYSNGKIYKIQ